ncbi:hypothetical protein PCANC_00832 [Puccinia coronata f. sp. avenae]|uniref:Uncharacterized protein n=1 Tax=Puccinia coronata f. sp. avenae TaxID=200324 RepID=A0A2N5W7F1_9BASI|nr:hypothetical protein PCASD_03540 [Puccinia coronata f. sp. avenae]PLW58184.1 hypothetical protein PCANC_00832 [Puccinia coronata f. sp. avenae]
MRLPTHQALITLLNAISLLVLTTGATPIRPEVLISGANPVKSETPGPFSAPLNNRKAFPGGFRPEALADQIDPGYIAALKKYYQMSPERQTRERAAIEKLNAPPNLEAKNQIAKLWDRIRRWFTQKRSPSNKVWDKTKAVGEASVAPVVSGLSLGIFGTWLACATTWIDGLTRIALFH